MYLYEITGDIVVQNVKDYKRGELLFKEGETPQNLYFIQSGKVSLFIDEFCLK